MCITRYLKHGMSLMAIFALLLLAVGSTDSGKGRSSSSSEPSSPPPPSKSKSPGEDEKQESRKAFIQKLIDKGIFHKVEIPGHLPHLWVKPAFYALDFDTKSQFVNVVYAYYVTQNPKYDSVLLYDSQTGKKIGKYAMDEVYGGLKLR